MRNLHNPKWLFFINTLPIVVLFFLFMSQFNIIKSLLLPENIKFWKIFGITLGSIGTLNFLYSVYLTFKKKAVSFYYGFIALLLYIPFLYFYGYYSTKIIPFSIPRWMLIDNIIFLPGTFLMPTIAYSLFILVTYFTPENKEHRPWKNFWYAIAIPFVWYIFAQVILPLWKPVVHEFIHHVVVIFSIVGTLFFFFYLIRGIYILVNKKSNIWKKYQLVWKVPVLIILPILGLLVNNGVLFTSFPHCIFGDFSNDWFYIIAAFNGLLICLPNRDKLLYRLLLFIGRSITFAFSFYFFIVFLPFLPFSIVAIALIGLGFLMLIPLIVFVVHFNELSQDFKYLGDRFSNGLLKVIFVSGFLILPLIITLSFIIDKNTLNQALDYLYTPDYSKSYNINEVSLKKTLNVLKHHKDRNRIAIFSSQLPYISSYFNWLVLDNMTISNAKIKHIEEVFFGQSKVSVISDVKPQDNIKITNTNVESVFDENKKIWRSWINLELTNNNETDDFAEYSTVFKLPVGCWISDYYLYIENRKEMGILADKKSASWVFSQIKTTNRDPGILYYLTGNKVALRIFPFTKDEVRRTGFELIHKEPVKITIDGINLQLGDNGKEKAKIIETTNNVYIPASEKSHLEKIQRQPYFHFLVDISEINKFRKGEYINRIKKLMSLYPDLSKLAKISKVNRYISTTDLDKNWEDFFNKIEFKGGFYLERAIKMTLVNSYFKNDKTYPIIIVVTDCINQAILDKDFSDLAITFPENNLFYLLLNEGGLETHSLLENPQEVLPNSPGIEFYKSCLAYKTENQKTVYISPDLSSSIALKTRFNFIDEKKVKEKDWNSALQIHCNWISQKLNPSKSKEWLNLIKSSFISRVMTPLTSYLVLENEAQKAMLKKKQELALSNNKSLDIGEEAQEMSEPSLIVLLILLVLIICMLEKSKRRSIQK